MSKDEETLQYFSLSSRCMSRSAAIAALLIAVALPALLGCSGALEPTKLGPRDPSEAEIAQQDLNRTIQALRVFTAYPAVVFELPAELPGAPAGVLLTASEVDSLAFTALRSSALSPAIYDTLTAFMSEKKRQVNQKKDEASVVDPGFIDASFNGLAFKIALTAALSALNYVVQHKVEEGFLAGAENASVLEPFSYAFRNPSEAGTQEKGLNSALPKSTYPESVDTSLCRTDGSDFSIGPSVADLVGYKWQSGETRKRRVPKVPPGLRELIQQEYQALLEVLPPSRRNRLSRWSLSFHDQAQVKGNSTLLWVRAEPEVPTGYVRREAFDKSRGGTIHIAPAVVRAIFFQSLRDNDPALLDLLMGSDLRFFDLVVGWPSSESADPYNASRAKYYNETSAIDKHLSRRAECVSRVVERFQQAFAFALAHEMAHVYSGIALGRTGSMREEARLDCYAVAHLRKTGVENVGETQGIMGSLLAESLSHSALASKWGVEELGDATLRARVLKYIPVWEERLSQEGWGKECGQLVAQANFAQ